MIHQRIQTNFAGANTATTAAILKELLNCAELNVDELEPETIELLGRAHKIVAFDTPKSKISFDSAKREIADKAFELYEFGESVIVMGTQSWDANDPLNITRIVFVGYDKTDVTADPERLSFHVRFNESGKAHEVYALDMKTGNEIGFGEIQL